MNTYFELALEEISELINELLTQNIEKLKLRYPEKFSNEKAIDRNVEAERELLEKDFERTELKRAIDCDNKKKEFVVGNYPDNNTSFKEIYLNRSKGRTDGRIETETLTNAVRANKELLKNINLEINENEDAELPDWGPEINFPISNEPFTQFIKDVEKQFLEGTSDIKNPKGLIRSTEGCTDSRVKTGMKIEKIKTSSTYGTIKQFDEYSIEEFNNALQFTECKTYSQQALDWIKFASKVVTHIEEYAVPQYGDKGNNEITDWSVEQVLKSVQKRIARYGRQSREGQQELDFLKMAHEVQIAWDKYIRQLSSEAEQEMRDAANEAH